MAPKILILVAAFLSSAGALWTWSEHKANEKLVKDVALVTTFKATGKPLTKELKAADEKWQKRLEKRSSAAIAEYNTNMSKGYWDVVVFLAPTNLHYNEHAPYRYDPFDVLSMMLLGIALYKLNVLSAKKSYRFYIIMALIGYGIGLSVNYYEVTSIMKSNFSFLGFSKSFQTYDLGRIPVAMGHIAGIMLLCKLPVLQWLKIRLAAVGKMALTNYIMHSIIALFVFTGAGMAMFGKLQRHGLLYIVFTIWIVQLSLSPIWLKYFQFGPIEWLWRNLSYQKMHAFRKTKVVAPGSLNPINDTAASPVLGITGLN